MEGVPCPELASFRSGALSVAIGPALHIVHISLCPYADRKGILVQHLQSFRWHVSSSSYACVLLVGAGLFYC